MVGLMVHGAGEAVVCDGVLDTRTRRLDRVKGGAYSDFAEARARRDQRAGCVVLALDPVVGDGRCARRRRRCPENVEVLEIGGAEELQCGPERRDCGMVRVVRDPVRVRHPVRVVRDPVRVVGSESCVLRPAVDLMDVDDARSGRERADSSEIRFVRDGALRSEDRGTGHDDVALLHCWNRRAAASDRGTQACSDGADRIAEKIDEERLGDTHENVEGFDGH